MGSLDIHVRRGDFAFVGYLAVLLCIWLIVACAMAFFGPLHDALIKTIAVILGLGSVGSIYMLLT